MDGSIIAAVGSLIIASISLFYTIGKDRAPASAPTAQAEETTTDAKLENIAESMRTINRKLDELANWKSAASSTHSAQQEQIKTLFHRVEVLESRLDSAQNEISPKLDRILERVGVHG